MMEHRDREDVEIVGGGHEDKSLSNGYQWLWEWRYTTGPEGEPKLIFDASASEICRSQAECLYCRDIRSLAL